MNKIVISSIIYYGRIYQEGEHNFYLNTVDFNIYTKDELKNVFKLSEDVISDTYVLQNDFNFVALFCVNIIDEMRNFLNNLNDRNITNKIKILDSEQLYIYFQSYIELNRGDHQRWNDYEKQCLTKAAVDWCKSWNIPYTA